MAQQMGNQPLIVLSEESQRTSGKDAQSMNITAGKAVAESVRTTLGPKGMDKMLVDSTGNVVVTNDGVTILKEMDIEHPAAQMLVEVADTQEEEVGDGTTTASVLAGQLLAKAEKLLENDGWSYIMQSEDEEAGWGDTRVAYYWNDLDKAGEKELTDFEALFSDRIEKISDIICEKLDQGEWDRAYILADHGFVDTGEDRFYGGGTGGYYVYDVTGVPTPEERRARPDTAAPTSDFELLTSLTGISGVSWGHTFTPGPRGRYAVAETEYQYAPLRIFDLQPGLEGEVDNISSPIAAWTTSDPDSAPLRRSAARSRATSIAIAIPVFMSTLPRP